jgi:toxin ParE1/3/4
VKPVTVGHWAEHELAAAVEYYEQCSAGLGLRFERAVADALQSIARRPALFPRGPAGTHRMVMKRFPYIIHYLDLPGRVEIVAFAHTSREPSYWRGRL